jgi:hypothetical protein
MDATAQLALMVKAKRVFESSGTFLSFPLAPMAYPPAVLDFSKALADPKTGAALLEFSRAVNQCPSGPIYLGDSDQYLWEQYDHWLNAMDLAVGDLSPDQKAAYTQARALLTVTDANGLASDSAALSTYKHCRDQYFDALQAYKSAQVTAASAASSATQTQWQTVDEPRMRQAVDQAMSLWQTDGNKDAIEAAQSTVATSEARMPRKVWEGWRNAYNPDLDVYNDAASNSTCAPSGFAPANMGAQPWTTFYLTGPEIQVLKAAASSELQGIFGETGVSTIQSLSFEFRSAAVVRPWFNTALFDARFWKFGDGSPDLSDGGKPPQGAWPAYVSAVVFARNIRVTTTAAALPQALKALPALALPPQTIQMLQTQRLAMIATPAAFKTAAPAAAIAQPALAVVGAAAMRPAGFAPVAAAPIRPMVAPAANPVLRLNTAMTYRGPLPMRPPGPTPVVIGFPPRPPVSPPAPPVIHPLPPAPPPPPASPPALPDDTISILAFICRPLGKAPNPDPALDWSNP